MGRAGRGKPSKAENGGRQDQLLADIVELSRRVFKEKPNAKISTSAYLLNMAVRLKPMRRVLKKTGNIYLHCDPDGISTSYVERQNLTMRMSMRRFTRLTNAFSKKLENHAHAVALHFMYYNFCRIHQTLQVTPAMAAGVTGRLWDVSDIVKMVEDAQPAPNRPKTHKKKSDIAN